MDLIMKPTEAEAKARDALYKGTSNDWLQSLGKDKYVVSIISSALLQAVEAEREACAELAQTRYEADVWYSEDKAYAAEDIAKAIRARGKDNV
jgi:hypothetical protein